MFLLFAELFALYLIPGTFCCPQGEDLLMARQESAYHIFCASFIIKMIILPRQAREKHREDNSKRDLSMCFLYRLNDRLRMISLDTRNTVPKLNNYEIEKIRGKNMVYYKEDGLDYLQLRLLTVAEREAAMGFPKLPSGSLWTHRARCGQKSLV
jgi:hypothetical protein